MNESEATSAKFDLEALRALQADAPELERIETLLDRFNVLAFVGSVNDELKHSDFLAFLFDPKRNDGLRDLLIKEMLKEALPIAHKTLSPAMFRGLGRILKNLDSIDLGRTRIRREHYDIDILLENDTHKLAVIIENKIGAPEGPGQLVKYDRFVRHIHPDWDVLKIYLTPYGADPTHKEYVPFSYGTLCHILERILEDGGFTLDPDVRISVEHYVLMVRRKILGDPEVVRLSQQLYKKHKRAFDLVCEHRRTPDVQAQIKEMIVSLITQEPRFVLDKTVKDNIKFGVRNWDTPALLTAEKWTPSRRILLFEFWNDSYGLNLNLFIGPGPEAIRQGLLGMVRANPEVFMELHSLAGGRELIFHRTILTNQEAYEYYDQEAREREIRIQWNAFLDEDLPRIETVLKKETWI